MQIFSLVSFALLALIAPTNAQLLSDTFFYGGQRNNLNADGLIKEVMSWGVKFHGIQFHDRPAKMKHNTAFFPPNPETNPNTVPDGSFYMMATCNDTTWSITRKLNAQDKANTYAAATVWGTVGKVDYQTDAILFQTCTIVSVPNNKPCPDFPTNCQVSAHSDYTQQMNADSIKFGDMVMFGSSSTIAGLTPIVQTYAQQTQQKIALPSGQITNGSKPRGWQDHAGTSKKD